MLVRGIYVIFTYHDVENRTEKLLRLKREHDQVPTGACVCNLPGTMPSQGAVRCEFERNTKATERLRSSEKNILTGNGN